jgi:hypothetical protein
LESRDDKGRTERTLIIKVLHLIIITLLWNESSGSSSSTLTASQAKAWDEDMEAFQYQARHHVYGILALAALTPPILP